MQCLMRALPVLALSAVACGEAEPRIAPEPSAGKLETKPALVEAAPPPTAADLARQRREAAAEAARREQERQEAERRAREEAERLAFERAYPLHGVVFHFVAQVFPEPSNRGTAIGYMRRGATLRAKRAVTGPGCRGGWHEVPGGGFVCAGEGYLVGDTPQTFEPSPVPPALDDALPYSYAYTTRDEVPQYWDLPSMEQEGVASEVLRQLRRMAEAALAEAEAAADTSAPALPLEAPDGGVEDAAEPEDTTAADAVEAPPPPGQIAETSADDQEERQQNPMPDFLRMGMLRGFYVSLDRREQTAAGRLFYRTVRGAYVRASEVTENTPPTSRGVVLGGAWELPVAIVFRTHARRWERRPSNGRLVERGRVDRHRALAVADDRFVHGDRRYVLGRDGTMVRDTTVRILRHRDRPSGIPTDAKWIHVRLSTQSLVAYEGDRAVFATLVSTGKEGFETPTGLFRIQSKHVSTTMDDDENPEGAYSIEDVPWTMYFHGNYALHGAFWHYTFGRVRSHGCVNLSPADARWLFQWSTPTLPASWHGIFSHPRRNPGTFVYIED
jgi:hypothetical protein